jgi:hypothetical protein
VHLRERPTLQNQPRVAQNLYPYRTPFLPGAPNTQVEELYSLDEATFASHAPVHGLIFLFKYKSEADDRPTVVKAAVRVYRYPGLCVAPSPLFPRVQKHPSYCFFSAPPPPSPDNSLALHLPVPSPHALVAHGALLAAAAVVVAFRRPTTSPGCSSRAK